MGFMTYIVFGIAALVTLGSALMVVTRRNMVHAALYLILALSGVTMIFVMLEAYYWAVIQVVVYIGAIAIMAIMAIMHTRDVTGKETEPLNNNKVLGVVLSLVVAATLIMALNFWPEFGRMAPDAMIDNVVIEELGIAFVSSDAYVLPTITASILLLGAFLGALKLAFLADDNKEEN